MKIVIISQHLFPIQTPRAHRTTELVKELGKRGYNVTVYAVLGKYDYSYFENTYHVKVKKIPIYFQKHPYSSDGDKHRTLIDKILGRLLGKLLTFPDIEFLFRVKKILKTEQNTDALITIANPHQINWGAARAKIKLKNKFPKVWIADCGDPFMENGNTKDHYNYFSYFEKKFCQNCDFITVPIESAKNGYYKEFRDKIRVIPQGFDFNLKEYEGHTVKNPIITFAYTGIFMKDMRNPTLFLNYLSSLTIEFRFIIYTPYTDLIDSFREKMGEKLIIKEPIKRELLLEELAKVDFVVNLNNVKTSTQVPSKLIDYAIVNKPILSINPSNPDKQLINSFLNRDYSGKYTIKNIQDYHISNVVDKYLKLIVR